MSRVEVDREGASGRCFARSGFEVAVVEEVALLVGTRISTSESESFVCTGGGGLLSIWRPLPLPLASTTGVAAGRASESESESAVRSMTVVRPSLAARSTSIWMSGGRSACFEPDAPSPSCEWPPPHDFASRARRSAAWIRRIQNQHIVRSLETG